MPHRKIKAAAGLLATVGVFALTGTRAALTGDPRRTREPADSKSVAGKPRTCSSPCMAGTTTPPGCETAFSGCAGGTGTFNNPITFATDQAELPVGTVVYCPPARTVLCDG